LSSAAAVLEDPGVAAVTPKVVMAGRFREVMVEGEPWHAPRDPRPLGRQIRSITVGGREALNDAVGAGLHDPETAANGEMFRWSSPGRPFYVAVEDSDEPVEVDGEPASAGPTVRLLNHAGSFLRTHGIAGEFGLAAPDDGRFDHPREPFGFSGTAPVFTAAALRRLGGFATPFFAYNEDTDWCLRARLTGLRIAYDPGATVTHRLSATSGGTSSERVRRLSQRNALLCLARNAPAPLAAAEIRQRLRRGPRDPVARQTARMLPWALSSRLAMSRRWVRDPADLWQQWAERDSTWDTSPSRPGAFV
jgi:hypothetical protein